MEIVQYLTSVESSIILQTINQIKIERLSIAKHTIQGLSRKLYNALIEFTLGTPPYCIPRIILIQSKLTSFTYCLTSTKSGRNDL